MFNMETRYLDTRGKIVVAGKHDITSVGWYLEYALWVEGM